MGGLRCSESLTFVSQSVACKTPPAAHYAGTISRSRATYRSGCRNEKHGARFIETGVTRLVSLTFAMKDGGGCGVTDISDLTCDAFVVSRSGGRSAFY